MPQDYLLIAVDSKKQFAIRFLWLKHGVESSLALKKPPPSLATPYAEFLLASVLLGSRSEDKESVLYKLHLLPSHLRINCEVNPLGAFRSALFPQESLQAFDGALKGQLQVAILNKKDQVYSSVLEISNGVPQTFEGYLTQSVQTASILRIHANTEYPNKNYALWIERLPQISSEVGESDHEPNQVGLSGDTTSSNDWSSLIERFSQKDFFERSFQETDDPDLILGDLLPFPFRILAVIKPRITCSCTLEAFERAIASLPREEVLELWMDSKPIESRCDYCGKLWTLDKKTIEPWLQTNSNVQ